MRIWNLTDFTQLEPTVLMKQSEREPLVRRTLVPTARSKSVRFALRVAALTAASFTVGATVGTSDSIGLSRIQEVVADNTQAETPPLDIVFRNRRDKAWTAEHEKELLSRMAKARAGSPDELVDLAETTQQESLAKDVQRLSRHDLLRIIKKKG